MGPGYPMAGSIPAFERGSFGAGDAVPGILDPSNPRLQRETSQLKG